MSAWKPELMVLNSDKWSRNALAFATEQEATEWAHDRFMVWTACEEYRAVEDPDAVATHSYVGRELKPLQA
jgi:hypothetical protein